MIVFQAWVEKGHVGNGIEIKNPIDDDYVRLVCVLGVTSVMSVLRECMMVVMELE